MKRSEITGNSRYPLQKCMAGEEITNLADHELLALILGSGVKNQDVYHIAFNLVIHFNSLAELYYAGLNELADNPGVGIKKAIRIKAAMELGRRMISQQNSFSLINSPEKVWKLLHPEMVHLKREEFRVLILNNKNHLLRKCIVSVGTACEALIHPREIFRDAIKESASSIIVAHNHPSGVTAPSREDIASSERIKKAGTILGIELIDHVIIGSSSYLSMKEAGYLS